MSGTPDVLVPKEKSSSARNKGVGPPSQRAVHLFQVPPRAEYDAPDNPLQNTIQRGCPSNHKFGVVQDRKEDKYLLTW
jgi:hypothetical protein